MNSILFAAAAPEGNPITEIASQFGVTWQLLISQVILFVIVALALKKFAYGPVLKVLEERRQRIAEGLVNADKIKQELATAQSKAQEILNQANTQGNRLIEEARQSAARVLEQETQKAVKAAQDLVAKAEQSNKAELERLRTDLMRHIGRLVADTTAKVVNKTLSPDDKQRLIEEANSQLNPSVPAS